MVKFNGKKAQFVNDESYRSIYIHVCLPSILDNSIEDRHI